ncbi:MAG: PfaD family polyunsaturated fatty acid/polyketide biosynthesis protein, partial [Planctomycetota bacterium]
PEWLGDRSFCEIHRVRFPYVAGAMANGIASVRLVVEMARAGCLSFFGAAGLAYDRVEREIGAIAEALGPQGRTWGANLIHSPQEPDLEAAVADLYIRRGVRRVSAAAYMKLTPAIVRYACAGLRADAEGRIQRTHHVFAKISRPEVARHFLSPAPADMLRDLVAAGQLTEMEARLAQYVPVAEDITAESDSGGHTDNRPLGALLPTIAALRDAQVAAHGFVRPIRVGAAGGLGTPQSVASAFALGAAYVLTGSVNQACVESGLSEAGKAMLARAEMADVVMAPAADMFEMGVEVQVLQRGTMFGGRAKKLYDLYREYPSLEALPAAERARLEKQVLRTTVEQAWAETAAFWRGRDPREIAKADADPKHKMALVFRSYLGRSSKWAIGGDADRALDYQIWCGPAMGAFNAWVRGSFLEPPEQRTAAQVARNLLEGATQITRAQQLRSAGVPVPPAGFQFTPRPLA